MQQIYKLPLVLDPQPEGGYTITCPLIPELITEADTLDEVNAHVLDALKSIINAHIILGRPLPAVLKPLAPDVPIWSDTLVTLELE